MAIDRFTTAHLRIGGPRDITCAPLPVTPDLEAYLTAHIEKIQRRANLHNAPPATFSDAGAERIRLMREGTEAEFLGAASEIAGGIRARMRGTAKAGLFLAARRVDGSRVDVVILKLQVAFPVAGHLGASNELEIVKQLLELPSERIEKAALVPDPRAFSEAVVNDAHDAAYFRDALEVRVSLKPKDGARELLTIIEEVKDLAAAQAAGLRLQSIPDVESTQAALARVPESVLTAQESERVLEAALARDQPVRFVDPSRTTLRERVVAGGLTISGTISAMQAVTWEKLEGVPDRWRIIIEVAEKPRREL